MNLEWEMLKRREIRVTIVAMIFSISHTGMWIYARQVSSESIDGLRERMATVREDVAATKADVHALQVQTSQNTAAIQSLTATTNALADSLNRFSGVGMAIGGLGGVLTILQGLSLLQRRKSARAG
jgi:cell division protein FtsB